MYKIKKPTRYGRFLITREDGKFLGPSGTFVSNKDLAWTFTKWEKENMCRLVPTLSSVPYELSLGLKGGDE